MKRIMTLSAERPLLVLLIMLLLSGLAISRIGELDIRVTPQDFLIEDDLDGSFTQPGIDQFGTDNVTVIYVQDEQLFEFDKLEHLRSVIKQLEKLPFVQKTESLFTVPHIRVVGDTVYSEPYLSQSPTSKQDAQHLIDAALQNPLIRNNLLAESAKALAINVYLKPCCEGQGAASEIVGRIQQTIAPLSGHFDTGFQIGLPYVRNHFSESILADLKRLIPLSTGVLFLTLVVIKRSIRAAFLPMLTAAFSVVWVLGLMAFLGIPLSVMTAIVPVLLVIVGSTEDIHLISEFHTATLSGNSSKRAVRYMARRMGLAVLLTFLTSCFGFLSIAVNPVPLMREFGLITASGLFLNFMCTILLVPPYLRYIGLGTSKASSSLVRMNEESGRFRYSNFLLRNKRSIIILMLAMIAIFGYGTSRLQVNNNLLNYFDDESTVRQHLSTVQKNIAGMEHFSIVLDSRIEGTFLKLRYLEEIEEIQHYIDNSGSFDASFSLIDMLSLFNSSVNDSGRIELPEDEEVLAGVANLIDSRKIKTYATQDFSRTRIVVRHQLESSRQVLAAVQKLEEFIRERTDPGLTVSISGDSIVSAKTSDVLISGQIYSLGFMLLIIFIVIALLFLSAKAGVLATLSSLVQIVVLFGCMGFLGIVLDTATAMIAAIALGICVDNTMHFMVRYQRKLKLVKNELVAIRQTVSEELPPIATSSITLIAGIGILLFSEFKPVAYFGLLTSMSIAVAFIVNFVFTPILLSSMRLAGLWDLMSSSLRHDLMRDCPLFQGINENQAKRLLSIGRLLEFEPGQTIYAAGDDSDRLMILLRGAGEMKYSKDTDAPVGNGLLTSGVVIGWWSWDTSGNEQAKIVAIESGQALFFERKKLHRRGISRPGIVNNLLINLVSQVNNVSGHLQNSLSSHEAGKRTSLLSL